jgi:hypothetical protein
VRAPFFLSFVRGNAGWRRNAINRRSGSFERGTARWRGNAFRCKSSVCSFLLRLLAGLLSWRWKIPLATQSPARANSQPRRRSGSQRSLASAPRCVLGYHPCSDIISSTDRLLDNLHSYIGPILLRQMPVAAPQFTSTRVVSCEAHPRWHGESSSSSACHLQHG